jgi:drug/metabolite transporter (DMT)-like permease
MLTLTRSRANLLLLLTAVIWGFAFVAQRTGMEHVGPFTFNAVRFFIGGLVLTPFIFLRERHSAVNGRRSAVGHRRSLLAGGTLAGAVLFAAATLQQVGIIFTTAGKAGFITSLYVVIVPLLGLALGHRVSAAVWTGAVLAAVGLYFLTIEGEFSMAWGDLLVLVGALLWAVHMLLLGRLSPGNDPVKLALAQFWTCAALSGMVALLTETITAADLRAALPPILFTGVMSIGVGYTLQVVAQGHTRPADTAIILSLEAVFAVVGGWLLLGEQLTARALIGCGLMLAGILISQLVGRPEEAGAAEISH